jgi:hypothetical protein
VNWLREHLSHPGHDLPDRDMLLFGWPARTYGERLLSERIDEAWRDTFRHEWDALHHGTLPVIDGDHLRRTRKLHAAGWWLPWDEGAYSIEYFAPGSDALEQELRTAGISFALGCWVQTPTLERMLDQLDAIVPEPFAPDVTAYLAELMR